MTKVHSRTKVSWNYFKTKTETEKQKRTLNTDGLIRKRFQCSVCVEQYDKINNKNTVNNDDNKKLILIYPVATFAYIKFIQSTDLFFLFLL